MKFTGEKCTLCGEVFKASDDVVVCPECGSPHHRECYKKHGRCANIYMHGTGQKWERTLKIPEEKSVTIMSPEDDESHTDYEKIHSYEYMDNSTYNAALMSDIGFNLNEDMGGVTLREILMFVGTNTLYYIPIFKKMKDFGFKTSFNLSCFLFPSLYFANRKMWLWAIIAAVISVILNIPMSIMIMAQSGVFTENILNVIYENQNFIQNMEVICSAVSCVVNTVMCLFANWIYFKFALKKLHIIKKNSSGGELNKHMVMAFGGVKPINIILITLITVFLILVSMVGITIFLTAI
ncbi:MAG: hypothetical protein NC205_02205 [Prevotella sp.]|nr:hypothetical protein [Alistipes senegalensis]MCM1357380.1 hypothetical protein [Prevotella sp.]MCM1473740.1 hypothetical protein [Muribaculaceae bacterium]